MKLVPDSCFYLPCFDYVKHVSKEIVLMTKGLMLDMMSQYLSASLCILLMRGILKWKELDWKRERSRLACLIDIMMLCDLGGQIFKPIFSCLWCCPMKTLPGPRAELAGPRPSNAISAMLFYIFSFDTRDQPLASSSGWSDWLNEDVGGVYDFSQKPFFRCWGVVHFWKQLWLNQRYLHILSWFGKCVANWSACQWI